MTDFGLNFIGALALAPGAPGGPAPEEVAGDGRRFNDSRRWTGARVEEEVTELVAGGLDSTGSGTAESFMTGESSMAFAGIGVPAGSSTGGLALTFRRDGGRRGAGFGGMMTSAV